MPVTASAAGAAQKRVNEPVTPVASRPLFRCSTVQATRFVAGEWRRILGDTTEGFEGDRYFQSPTAVSVGVVVERSVD